MIRIFGQRINRWGRDYRRDSGRAEQPESWAWYKLSWKRRQLGGGSQTLSRLSLFMAGAVAAFCGTIGNGCPSDRIDENICKL